MATISVSQVKNVHVIEIIGRLDGDSAPEMGRLLDQTLDEGHRQLVLDLGSVDYMSSPGLREIVRVFKRAQQASGDLRVANPSGVIPVEADVIRKPDGDWHVNTISVYRTQRRLMEGSVLVPENTAPVRNVA